MLEGSHPVVDDPLDSDKLDVLNPLTVEALMGESEPSVEALVDVEDVLAARVIPISQEALLEIEPSLMYIIRVGL